MSDMTAEDYGRAGKMIVRIISVWARSYTVEFVGYGDTFFETKQFKYVSLEKGMVTPINPLELLILKCGK